MEGKRYGWYLHAALAATLALLWVLALHHQADEAAAHTRAQARGVAEAVSALPLEALIGPGGPQPGFQRLLALAHQPGIAYAALVSPEGQVLIRTAGVQSEVPAAALHGTPKDWAGERELVAADGTTTLHEFFAPVMRQGELAGVVRIGCLPAGSWAYPSTLPFLALLSLPLLLLALVQRVAMRRALRPLGALADRLEHLVAPGRAPLERRTGKDPLTHLQAAGAALDGLAERLRERQGSRLDTATSGKLLGYQKARSEAVLNALPDAVLLLDPEGKVSFASGKLRPLLGVSPEEALGRTVREWCPVESVSSFLAPYQTSGERAHRAASREYQAPGSAERHVTATAVPLDGNSGAEFAGTVVNFRDTTQEQLARRARDEFVGHVAHELKAPLQVLTLYSEMLLDNPDCERALRLEAANAIHSESAGMAELISNLLSIGRIESGSIALERGRVRLPELLREVFRSATSTATARELETRLSVPDEMTQLALDKGLMAIALKNLVNNAVKYNRPRGNVTVLAEEHPDRCVIRVRDTGIGVHPEERERIFDKFYRSADPEAARRGGHGLGLFLTRQIIELHGGELSFESEAGEGSEFRVVIRKTPQNLAESV